jgi:hypothetical protein
MNTLVLVIGAFALSAYALVKLSDALAAFSVQAREIRLRRERREELERLREERELRELREGP